MLEKDKHTQVAQSYQTYSESPNKQDSDYNYLNDYEYIARDHEVSIKYLFSLKDKPLHVLSCEDSKDSIKNMPIVCSYADMQFKLSPQIKKGWVDKISDPNLNLGYAFFPSTRKQIVQRLKRHVNYVYKKQQLILINSMLTFYYLVVTELTQKGDQVLIFTPTYYRFVYTLEDERRDIVQYELKTRQSNSGQTEFYIDFGELQKVFEQNKIKMMVFSNPHNPSGKIWTREQLTQLKNLCLKHNCLIFSDDIFYDCVQKPKNNYTSFLQFPQIYQNLIWASSFGKAFNCSGNSFTYAIIQNKSIQQKIRNSISKINAFPTYAEAKLLQSCYTVGDGWRLRTIKYIQENYLLLKEEIRKRNLKVDLYKLDSAFLPVLDFAKYKWPHSQIKKRLETQNLFPTYFQSCYIKRQKQSITCIRFNIAMNRQVFKEFIDRLQRALKN